MGGDVESGLHKKGLFGSETHVIETIRGGNENALHIVVDVGISDTRVAQDSRDQLEILVHQLAQTNIARCRTWHLGKSSGRIPVRQGRRLAASKGRAGHSNSFPTIPSRPPGDHDSVRYDNC
jgi:hypothetical protein